MTVLAVPATILLESGLGWLLASEDLLAVRAMLEPTMTLAAWGLCAVTAIASVAALMVGYRLAARRRFGVGAFLIVASLAQVPAMVAALTRLAGAALVPVLCGAAISTASVGLLALRVGGQR